VSLPARRTFTRLNEEAVHAIGRLFRATAHLEPYSPDGSPVYRMTMGGAADGIRLILWPSLNRVDVNSAGTHGWVLKDVGQVEVIEGVEVVFHPREGEGHLFVSVNGFVNMVMG
jgi:hypothetical protein